MDPAIREADLNDEAFLREMLFQAIFVEEGGQPPPRSVLSEPAIARYIENWGRKGDYGLIAELDGEPIGAIWVRLFAENNRGFGWVSESTPELSMAVEPNHRGHGIGTKLLEDLLKHLSTRHRAVSLSVSPENPVIHLYKRQGFIEVGKSGTSITMRCSLV